MYSMCSVLAPTTTKRISSSLFPSLVNIKDAKHLNMCRFVIDILQEKARSGSGSAYKKACMLFLMVKYLDSLQLEGLDVPEGGTRVSAWTNDMVRKAIMQDMGSDGCFGMAPLKPQFASINVQPEAVEDERVDITVEGGKRSILFADRGIINKFIEAHTPSDRTVEESDRYKQAIEVACYGFETRLELLARNLSQRPSKEKIKKAKNLNSQRPVKQKRKKTNNLKKQDAKSCTENVERDVTPTALGSAPDGSDDWEDEDLEQTQPTVSLADETGKFRGTWQHPQDEIPLEDDRLIRRKRRANLGQSGDECNLNIIEPKAKEETNQGNGIIDELASASQGMTIQSSSSRIDEPRNVDNMGNSKDAIHQSSKPELQNKHDPVEVANADESSRIQAGTTAAMKTTAANFIAPLTSTAPEFSHRDDVTLEQDTRCHVELHGAHTRSDRQVSLEQSRTQGFQALSGLTTKPSSTSTIGANISAEHGVTSELGEINKKIQGFIHENTAPELKKRCSASQGRERDKIATTKPYRIYIRLQLKAQVRGI